MSKCESCNTESDTPNYFQARGKYQNYWICQDCTELYNEAELRERLGDGSVIS